MFPPSNKPSIAENIEMNMSFIVVYIKVIMLHTVVSILQLCMFGGYFLNHIKT